MEDVTAATCVEFAVKVEEIGAELYENLARKFSSDCELTELFAGLGRDELQHRDLFRAFHARALSQPAGPNVPNVLAHHVRATSMSNVFSGMGGLHGDVEAIRSRDDALERALHFEKATLGFFQAMREVFPDDEVLTSLVAIEKSHVKKVMELMVTGAKYRGLGDRF